jgi:hypothetical protein
MCVYCLLFNRETRAQKVAEEKAWRDRLENGQVRAKEINYDEATLRRRRIRELQGKRDSFVPYMPNEWELRYGSDDLGEALRHMQRHEAKRRTKIQARQDKCAGAPIVSTAVVASGSHSARSTTWHAARAPQHTPGRRQAAW